MREPPRPPVERVRSRLAATAGRELAAELPRGYQRLGRVVLLRLAPGLRPFDLEIGRLFQEELGVETVLAYDGPMEGEGRRPRTRKLAGGTTEAVVHEGGIVYHLDAARTMFASGNRTERRRAGEVVRPGERVADLFAGIGYFTLPAAKFGRPAVVHAVEREPLAFSYLQRNVKANHVERTVVAHLADNREADLAPGSFDRVFLGWLPSSIPFLPRALELLSPEGGTLHVHHLAPALQEREALELVARAVAHEGRRVAEARLRRVKPYGPGRSHVVVDARVGP